MKTVSLGFSFLTLVIGLKMAPLFLGVRLAEMSLQTVLDTGSAIGRVLPLPKPDYAKEIMELSTQTRSGVEADKILKRTQLIRRDPEVSPNITVATYLLELKIATEEDEFWIKTQGADLSPRIERRINGLKETRQDTLALIKRLDRDELSQSCFNNLQNLTQGSDSMIINAAISSCMK